MSEDGGPWEVDAVVCITRAQAAEIDDSVRLPGLVARAFRRLSWPVSRMDVRPPGGVTLVNFENAAATTNDGSTTRSVRLLGRGVEIEATPQAYVWRWGDGTVTRTTTPGIAYPKPGFTQVSHSYMRKTARVVMSVDTVYRGRYRVDGGAWVPIPDTLTVPGPGLTYQVKTATPHLAGPD